LEVGKSKEVKTGRSNCQEWTNLAEFSIGGYGPEGAVFLIMIMKCGLLSETLLDRMNI
jgi:hypothetical protein